MPAHHGLIEIIVFVTDGLAPQAKPLFDWDPRQQA
jgi:hypothetical protein